MFKNRFRQSIPLQRNTKSNAIRVDNDQEVEDLLPIASTRSNEDSQKKECQINLILAILPQIVTSLIMHLLGLIAIWKIEGKFISMLKPIIGAGLEGVLLVNILSSLTQRKSKTARGIAFVVGFSSFIFLLSNVRFMQKTDVSSLPDMFVVISGLREAFTLLKSEISSDTNASVSTIIQSSLLALPTVYLVWEGTQSRSSTNRIKQPNRNKQFYFFLFIANTIFYCSGAWMPIFHTYASACGSLIFSPPGKSDKYVKIMKRKAKDGKNVQPPESAPNIVLLIHESLSGEYIMTNETVAKLMPFYQKMLNANDDEYFVFENVRSVSGDTADALPAITTGCLPVNHQNGRGEMMSNSIATEAKRRGYDTVSFSSRSLNMGNTKWFIVQDMLSVNFNKVFRPSFFNKKVNQAAMSDRLMGINFQKWLSDEKRLKKKKKPFFAQFYYFDSHYPFYKDPYVVSSGDVTRIDGMFQTVDKDIENIFEYLRDSGELDNTIVIGSGDHGEALWQRAWRRLRNLWDSDIIHPASYMYIPKKVSAAFPNLIENLKHNRHQLVSTLDFYPTMLHLLDGKSSKDNYPVSDDNCIRGFDLIGSKIMDNRTAWSFPGVMTDFTESEDPKEFAFHYGTSSSLYYREKKYAVRILEYKDIYGSPKTSQPIKVPLSITEWKDVIKRVKLTDETLFATKGLQAILENNRMNKTSVP